MVFIVMLLSRQEGGYIGPHITVRGRTGGCGGSTDGDTDEYDSEDEEYERINEHPGSYVGDDSEDDHNSKTKPAMDPVQYNHTMRLPQV